MPIKLLRVILILIVPVLSLSVGAEAFAYDFWSWYFDATISDPSADSSPMSEFGANLYASDNYDLGDYQIETDGITSAIYAATYHNTDDGWLGTTDFYCKDARLLPTQVGDSKTWNIYVWATPNVSDIYTTIYASCFMIMPEYMPDNYSFTLKLVAKPDSVLDGQSLGQYWNLSDPRGVSLELPIYRTDNGLTGYKFEFSATVIPEPSSLLALLSGLAGIGSMAWRMKR